MDNSQGLVDGYVKEIMQLGAKRQMGEDFATIKIRVDEVIKKAHEHIALWVNGTPEGNWATFGGKLNFAGHTAGDKNWADVLLYAGETVRAHEPPKRSK